jgi:hypothetical protein
MGTGMERGLRKKWRWMDKERASVRTIFEPKQRNGLIMRAVSMRRDSNWAHLFAMSAHFFEHLSY